MISRLVASILLIISIAFAPVVHAIDSNYPDRKAIVLNTCPLVQLSDFSFGNKYADRRNRFEQNLSWKNTGPQPLSAFEIVVLKYDAFDQRLIGSRWVITGHNSADWEPLAPEQASSDGTIGYGTEEVFTAIAYVRAARLADGTVWRVSEAQLINDLKKVAPGIKDFGSTKPDPKPQKNE
ncbi:hypothetical protein GTP91_06975 [Rugamonas sp. FT82W]|uniref:DUF4352 domain-containing protein n=1 Tax=Duganella vulcania TaxID=2692166 RepID=A0A845G2E8_9BURK|nr:hypothetical protein [Duganella vulcania]MYM86928.1 hypothetical protein [Duganella vulcania]